jgi:hypothetical protein
MGYGTDSLVKGKMKESHVLTLLSIYPIFSLSLTLNERLDRLSDLLPVSFPGTSLGNPSCLPAKIIVLFSFRSHQSFGQLVMIFRLKEPHRL